MWGVSSVGVGALWSSGLPRGNVTGVSGVRDSITCLLCPSDQWPNQRHTACVKKLIEFLSPKEPLGATLTGVAGFSSIVTVSVLVIFIRHSHTPIVKANNRELSYLLLGAILLTFLCSFLFLLEPQPIVCLVQQSTFGITFVLCISCVLAKTIMVVMAFNAIRPGRHMRWWLSLQVSLATITVCTLGQVLICAAWLLFCPPFPEKYLKLKTATIIFECNECSDTAFWCMMGYMGLLACVSFLVAFLARDLPDSFNEAKWITFSMLVFLSVWMSFVPGYLSTQGKYMVAVEIFSIVSSSAGLLACIFMPKCYIILMKPELNIRQQLLRKGTTHNC
ncbi:vomeronasal type-2 receptor 26-like [Ambystoma mexicanum]|uniref:vomeronasal type-2 receptor 26-like n=1 Tax=Ambystoma mexicanum TaxID=8296 RepID=UPI0037E94AA8